MAWRAPAGYQANWGDSRLASSTRGEFNPSVTEVHDGTVPKGCRRRRAGVPLQERRHNWRESF